jgi:hypothetical protein
LFLVFDDSWQNSGPLQAIDEQCWGTCLVLFIKKKKRNEIKVKKQITKLELNNNLKKKRETLAERHRLLERCFQ